VPTPTAAAPARPGLLTASEAASWLRISLRQIVDRADLPRLDVAAPNSARPQWRYRVSDLEAFAAARVVAPYEARAAAQGAR
jgi:hypothetical protein